MLYLLASDRGKRTEDGATPEYGSRQERCYAHGDWVSRFQWDDSLLREKVS